MNNVIHGNQCEIARTVYPEKALIVFVLFSSQNSLTTALKIETFIKSIDWNHSVSHPAREKNTCLGKPFDCTVQLL